MARSIKFSDDTFLDASGITLGTNHDLLEQMLNPRSVAIGNSFTFSQLIAKNVPTFFSNWNDNTNFPEYYGVGVYIPTVDPNIKFILYLTIDGGLYLGKYQNNAITWRHYLNS